MPISVIEAPSTLGLTSQGVEQLPDALKSAGLLAALGVRTTERVVPPPASRRDPVTGVRNLEVLERYARLLATAVLRAREQGQFPLVLGGDCSNIIGIMLALRRAGRHGLFFIDGHADFYQPEAEPNGEAASMDLAIVSGRGPATLANIDGLAPLVRDDDIVAFGYRDADQQREFGSQDLRETAIHAFDLAHVRALGAAAAAQHAASLLEARALDGFWIHVDADVLDDAVMPAVDYRIPDGFSWDDLSTTLRVLMATGRAVGINIGIFNPRLDADGSVARRLAACLAAGLTMRRS
jgi:arginase